MANDERLFLEISCESSRPIFCEARGRRRSFRRGPGRTRTINFYLINSRVLFADLPGYGYAKVSRAIKEAWWRLVEGYLREREQLRGVVHIVDARHPPTVDDQEMQDFLRAVELPSLVAMTKADKLERGRRLASRNATVEALGLPDPEAPLFVSAETGEGIPELWRAIDERLAAGLQPAM
jgi:GTP-binding protein